MNQHARPAPRHSLASSSLGGELVSPFDKGCGGPGGWWVLDEPEIRLGRDVVVPDPAGWRRERMPGCTLEDFALRDGAWTPIAALKNDEEVRVAPFDAIALPLSVLWPD